MFYSLVLPDCLENIPLVPVYQRAVLRAAWAQVWEWAVGELRAHVLKAEQHCVAAHSTGRLLKGRDNPTYKDSNLSCRDHNILASMPLSRFIFPIFCYLWVFFFLSQHHFLVRIKKKKGLDTLKNLDTLLEDIGKIYGLLYAILLQLSFFIHKKN